MSRRLQDHVPTLRRLVKSGNKERQKIIDQADDELIKCICECAQNTINSNVPLTERQLKKLFKHKDIVRKLACKNLSIRAKRKKIKSQKGGFLLPLLAPILTAVIENILI
jgi:histone H3/H4